MKCTECGKDAMVCNEWYCNECGQYTDHWDPPDVGAQSREYQFAEALLDIIHDQSRFLSGQLALIQSSDHAYERIYGKKVSYLKHP